MKVRAVCLLAAALTGCGYHVSGHADLLPKSIKTIAIPGFGNVTIRYKLADRVGAEITREFIQRTRYAVVADPKDADAVLTGAVVSFMSYPTTYDPETSRASGVQAIVNLQLLLLDKNGKVLFHRPNMEIRERYEIAVDAKTYFDESGPAMDRLARDVARSVVSAVLENFCDDDAGPIPRSHEEARTGARLPVRRNRSVSAARVQGSPAARGSGRRGSRQRCHPLRFE